MDRPGDLPVDRSAGPGTGAARAGWVSSATMVSVSAQPANRYLSGSAANMVRSLVVIVALMAVVILIVPRVNRITQPPVDVAGSADTIASQSGWPIEIPVGLPDGWRATSVRYERSTDGVMTWHVGYETPDNQYVAIEQAKDPTTGWVTAEVNRAAQKGTVEAGGRTWTTYVRDLKVQNSLVNRPSSKGELTTIITGTGTFAQLTEFVEHLQVVKPSSPSPSAT